MLKVGILGASRIVPWAILEPAARRDDVEVVAIAARRPGAAADLAGNHDIGKVYDSYEAVISDPDVDLVYNPLPPHLHADWSIRALEAGKHVLCEKPFAMTASEAIRMNEAAQRCGRRIVEAFHDAYHPVFRHILHRVNSGDLGRVQTIDATFSHTIPRKDGEFRRIKAMGGGALMDLGCYPVHWCRLLAGEEPLVSEAVALHDPSGYDEEISATLKFPSGVVGRVESKMSEGWHYHARLVVTGETSSLTVENNLLPHLGHSFRFENATELSQYTIGGNTTFDYQMEALVRGLQDGTPLKTEGADPIANMTTIDAIYAAAGIER